jgi:hypothetical protein
VRAVDVVTTEHHVLDVDAELLARLDAMSKQLDDLRAGLRARAG